MTGVFDRSRGGRGARGGLPALAALWTATALAVPAAAQAPMTGGIDIRPAETDAGASADRAPADRATGIVFHDLSRDGVHQADEPGVPDVLVSNGRAVVRTDGEGRYSLPVEDDMIVSVVQPSGWQVPLSEQLVPQFFYNHKPGGTPEALRYGGLPDTGPLPAAINFPLVPSAVDDTFSCVVMGDTQTYSNTEVGYLRDGIVDGLLARDDLEDAACMMLVGDVMGDDLDLLPRFMDLMSLVGLPQYYMHGNHDFDFDASSDAHSADSWRHLYGPNYYAYEIGEVLFVALDNVVYPCGPEDHAEDDRAACTDAERTVYNGRVDARQMAWLEALLAETPRDRLIVLAHHIPFVSFVDSTTGRHQTDNAAEIYALLAGRPALSLSGHTHTLETLAAGEWFEGWDERVGVTRLPFDHIVTGAPSGNWWGGDFGFDGTPLSFARGGTPPGYLVIAFDGNRWSSTFHASNQPADRAMALSINTPGFREWFETLIAWQDAQGRGAGGVPPVTVNDLPDQKLLTPEDLAEGAFLTANVWNGDRHTRVTATIGDRAAADMTRTQEGEGEAVRSGAEWADPFAAPRQMTVGRYAYQSESGDPRAQGFELWQGTRFGPAPPQAMTAWQIADASPHLWRLRLPEDLPPGAHVATVTVTDRHGRRSTDRIAFEVRAERPAPRWRDELWQDAAN